MNKNILIVLRDLRVGNGIAECIRNYYDALLEQQFRVDFLLLRDIESQFSAKAKENGNIYIVPQSKIRVSIAVKKYISEIMKNGNYSIVHVNLPGPIGVCVLKSAQDNNIPVRIYHSHNPRNTMGLKATISSGFFNPLCVKYASDYLACSESAGKSVFGSKSYTVMKNLIDAEKYRFSIEKREKLRQQLKISENTFVVGTVGRLDKQKNPFFALQCFREIQKKKPEAYFIWVGEGNLKEKVEYYIKEENITNIILLGSRNDVDVCYSAFDCFVLPSRFEGLGIVFLEAQAAGLHCFGSDKVPEDTKISPLMHRISTSKGSKFWGDYILDTVLNEVDRANCDRYVISSGYDTTQGNTALAEYYKKKLIQYDF